MVPGSGNSVVAFSQAMRRAVEQMGRAVSSGRGAFLWGPAGSGRHFLARRLGVQGPMTHIDLAAACESDPLHQGLAALSGPLLLEEAWAHPSLAAELAVWHLNRNVGPVFVTSCIGPDDPLWEPFLPVLSRLEVVVVPPLRERAEDVAGLVTTFLAEGSGRPAAGPTKQALELLASRIWSWTALQLKVFCHEMARHLPRDGRLDHALVAAHLPDTPEEQWLDQVSFDEIVRQKIRRFLERLGGYRVLGLRRTFLNRLDRHLIELVLEMAGGNQKHAAEFLGISRNTLRRRIRELGIAVSSQQAR